MTSGRRPESDDKIPEIIRMLSLGWAERQICESLGISKGSLHRIKKRLSKLEADSQLETLTP